MIDTMTLDELKKAIAEREAKVEALEKRKRGARNYRLVVDLPLEGVPADGSFAFFPPLERTAVVRKGTIFYVKEIEAVLSVVGSEVVTGTSVTRVIAPPLREQCINFKYKIRDTGSDRDWQNDWIPGPALLGANINGLRFGTAHAAVSGGSEIVVNLQAQLSDATLALLGMSAISSYFFQFNFNGVEVQAPGGGK